MDRDERIGRYQREIEAILEAMEQDGVAGGTVGPRGATMGIPNWAEQTKDQRFSQKVRTHGYPLGLAKSTRWRRDRLITDLQDQVSRMSPNARAVHESVHEALAWALDAERFLGSFNRPGGDTFPPHAADAVADHLLIWLRERGCTVIPISADSRHPTPFRDLELHLDPFSGMLLDPPTYDRYRQVLAGDLSVENAGDEDGVVNAFAARWCRGLSLSGILDGESLPLVGTVGQYGRYGCVLLETAASEMMITRDVCLFPYDPMQPELFIDELVSKALVTFVDSEISIMHIVERISGQHTISREDLGPATDRDLPQVRRQTDVQAALAWGKHHARRLTDADGG